MRGALTTLIVATALTTAATAATAAHAGTTAAQRYAWGAPAWSDEFGGTALAGGWVAYDSAGNGGYGVRRPAQIRVAGGAVTLTGTADARSAGMVLDSRREPYGRWEARVRARPTAIGGRPYHAVLALIPAGDEPYHCGATDVDFAEFDVGDPVDLFVHALPDRQDDATTRAASRDWHDDAIELTPAGFSWYVDGRVVVTSHDRRLVSGVPLSVNLQLDAEAPSGLQPAVQQADWVRYYPLRGATLPAAPAPGTGRYDSAC